MPSIFDLLYREYCRARLAEMRKQLLISPKRHEVYVDTNKQVDDCDHLNIFASEDAAETWIQENDPEGVAFEYEVLD